MGLPNLLYAAPNEATWREFWFYHYQDHLEIVQALSTLGFPVQNYVMNPWVSSDHEGILEQHQQYHNDMNQILAVAGADLSTLDFKKENEVKGWIYLNYQEHLSAHTLLNI